jgi:O-acetylserine/cysteine efflux transporter
MTSPPLRPIEWAAATLVVVLWGLNFVAVKLALVDLPPYLLTGLRFALTALVLAPFFRPARAQMGALALLGLVMGVFHFGLLFYGVTSMDAATAAIMVELAIPFSSALAWLVFKEVLGPGRTMGMVVAFLGVALLAGEPHMPGPIPFAAVVLSGFAWAVGQVVIKRMGPIHPLALNGWMALFSAPMLIVVSLGVEADQLGAMARTSVTAWAGVAYSFVCSTLIAYSLWYWLISRHPMNKVVPFTFLGPVVGVAAGVTLLGEPLTWQKLVGGLLTMAGVALVQLLAAPAIPLVERDEP